MMAAILGLAMMLAAPDPTLEQATICSVLASGSTGDMAVAANRATATDADRTNLRLVMDLHARASARAMALINANPLDAAALDSLRSRVKAAVEGARADRIARLAECATLFAVK